MRKIVTIFLAIVYMAMTMAANTHAETGSTIFSAAGDITVGDVVAGSYCLADSQNKCPPTSNSKPAAGDCVLHFVLLTLSDSLVCNWPKQASRLNLVDIQLRAMQPEVDKRPPKLFS